MRDFSNLSKDYIVLVDHKEFLDKAQELGYEYVELYDGDEVDAEIVDLAKAHNKIIIRLDYKENEDGWGLFMPYRENELSFRIREPKTMAAFNLFENRIGSDDPVRSLKKAIRHFPKVEILEYELSRQGIILYRDYTNRCGNCHRIMEEEDKYCRYCGTPRGEGAFLPYENIVRCIYAPPITVHHKCVRCGYSWTVNVLGGDGATYCPKCRGKLDSKEEKRLFKK